MKRIRQFMAPAITLTLALLMAVLLLMRKPLASEFIQPASGDLYITGQRVYNQHCASCHGANGEGQFPAAPLRPDNTGRYGAPPHNPAGHSWHHPDQLLLEITKHGHSAEGFYPMPAFGDKLSDAEIYAVLAYIKAWWEPMQLDYQGTQTAKEAAKSQ